MKHNRIKKIVSLGSIVPISSIPLIVTSCSTKLSVTISSDTFSNDMYSVEITVKGQNLINHNLISKNTSLSVSVSNDSTETLKKFILTKTKTITEEVEAEYILVKDNQAVYDPIKIKLVPTTFNLAHRYNSTTQSYTDKIVRWGNTDLKEVYIPDTLIKHHDSYMKSTWTATVRNMNFLYNYTHDKDDNGTHLGEKVHSAPIHSKRLYDLTKDEFIDEYNKFIDKHLEYNLNSVIFQVRPNLDAFYNSTINPLSTYLVGSQGYKQSWINSNFDPLTYMVDYSHQKNLAYHAWVNPYRVSTSDWLVDDTTNTMTSYDYLSFWPKRSQPEHDNQWDNFGQKLEDNDQIARSSEGTNYNLLNWIYQLVDDPTHPGLKIQRIKAYPNICYKFGGALYLNPGEQQVRDYVVESIMEIVNNYDVDGIHMDDYFYPETTVNDKYVREGGNQGTANPISLDSNGNWKVNNDYPDKTLSFGNFYGEDGNVLDYDSYEQYIDNGGTLDIKNWRRENNNLLVKSISDAIKQYNIQHDKHVEFGISPGGIWASKQNTPGGSDTPTTSMSTYNGWYYDSKKWVEESWIDYIIPQIYWPMQQTNAPFCAIYDWWADVVKNSGSTTKLYIGQGNYRIIEDYVGKTNYYDENGFGNPEEIKRDIYYAANRYEYQGSVFFSITDLDDQGDLTYRDIHYWDDGGLCMNVQHKSNQYIKEIMKEL